jgi:membrane-associated protease RseP (regulator of RpoE activity)
VTEEGNLDRARELAALVHDVFAVDSVMTGVGDGRVVQLRGSLLTDSASAYDEIAARFRPLGYTPLLRLEPEKTTDATDDRVQLLAIPVIFSAKPNVDRRAIVLFVLTVLSVLFVGGLMEAPDFSWLLRHPLAGLPFAATLMGILIAHEAGHYFMSRRLGVTVSLPYFIPLPLPPFGTMGSIIHAQTPMRNRRQVLAIGAAGPLAGLAVAIPLLIYGLLHSTVQPVIAAPGSLTEGNSLLYAGLKFLIFGRLLPGGGFDVFLHPVAFAAWGGLLVTMLNLMPAGQLDGGHVAYALLGKRTRWLNRLLVVATAVLGAFEARRGLYNWLVWSALLLWLGQRSDEPLDDVTTLRLAQKMLAIGMLVLFVLLFTPRPLS